MLNQMTVMRAPVPQNQFVALDPLAMRRSDYNRPAITTAHSSTDDTETQHTESDPFLLASPFCNPDL